MKDWFLEVLVVIAHSNKIQAAIWIGCLGFIIINLLGSYGVGSIELNGFLAPLTETIRTKLNHRYDKVAMIWLLSFAILAFKVYKKEHRRLFGL